jgi:hypothetical protein
MWLTRTAPRGEAYTFFASRGERGLPTEAVGGPIGAVNTKSLTLDNKFKLPHKSDIIDLRGRWGDGVSRIGCRTSVATSQG